MIRRWLLRGLLVVGAYFLGSFATFFLVMLVTWDQGLLDLFGIIVGVASSAFAFFKSGALTHRSWPDSPERGHRR